MDQSNAFPPPPPSPHATNSPIIIRNRNQIMSPSLILKEDIVDATGGGYWERVGGTSGSNLPCQRSLHAGAVWHDLFLVFGGYVRLCDHFRKLFSVYIFE